MTQPLFKLFGQIQKVEEQADGTVMVYGVASSGARDSAGEVVEPAAMKAALPDYSKFPALREMHQPLAAGKVAEADVDDDGITHIAAHVVDPTAVLKVKTGVYAGFSIGGKVTKRDSADRSIITGLRLVEISLVDSPCNPDAVLSMWKADTMTEFKPASADVIARAKTLAKAAGTARFKDFLFEAGQELISEHLIEKGELEPPAAEEPAAVVEEPVIEPPAGEEPAKEAAVVVETPAAEAPVVEAEPAADVSQTAEGKEAAAAPDPDEDDHAGEGGEAKQAVANPDLVDALEAAIAKGTDAIEAAAVVDQVADPFADFEKVAAALRGIGVEPTDPLVKGMYEVSRFADLLCSFSYVQRSLACEAEYEGDGSPIPAQLAEAIKNLGALLVNLAQEEVAELVASLMGDGGDEVVIVYSGDECCLAEKIVDLVKTNPDLMEKAGARNSKPADDKDEVKAAAEAERITALETDNEKLTKALAEAAPAVEQMVTGFTETIDALKGEVAELRKRFEDEPLPPKTAGTQAARVVSKSADSSGLTNEPEAVSQEQFEKAWNALPEAERGNVLVKIALANPTRIALPGGR